MATVYGDDVDYRPISISKTRNPAVSEKEPSMEASLKSGYKTESNLDAKIKGPGIGREKSVTVTQAILDDYDAKLSEIYERQMQDSDYEHEWEDADCGGLVVAEGVSCEEFDRICTEYEWSYRIQFISGRIIAFGIESEEHQSGIDAVAKIIQNSLLRIGGIPAKDAFKYLGAVTIHTGKDKVQPDYYMRPLAFRRGSYPTLVLEVEYRNRSYDSLKKRLKYWLTVGDNGTNLTDKRARISDEMEEVNLTRIQIALGLKMHSLRRNASRRIQFVYMDRGCIDSPIEYEVGTYVPANILELWSSKPQPATLELDLSLLFYGTGIPACFGEHTSLVMDLVKMKNMLSDV